MEKTRVGSVSGVGIRGGDVLGLEVVSSMAECTEVQVLASGERQQGINWGTITPLLGVVSGWEVWLGGWLGSVSADDSAGERDPLDGGVT